MNQEKMLAASARVALAALLHDIGKFAERAGMASTDLDGNKAIYCPLVPGQQGRYSHIHAAFTGIAMDGIENHLPDIKQGVMHPFKSWGDRSDDSLINAAAMHHKPETPMQRVIATADRLASGFERREFDDYNQAEEGQEEASGKRVNHLRARLMPLLETVTLTGRPEKALHRYPLRAMAPETLFPMAATDQPGDDKKAREDYRILWEEFLKGLEDIPAAHRSYLPLWLDHFDSLWLTLTHAIPSATATRKPGGGFLPIPADVSLYDHSKAVAALAVALWRYHDERATLESVFSADGWRNESQEDEFFLIQGDFSGIQEFIFASGETSDKAAKRLRGRSFMVSLLTELAAMKVLQAFALPVTSQITNAAGKFLIVAPRLPDAEERVRRVAKELDQWFLDHTFGISAIGLATTAANRRDFAKGDAFKKLINHLFAALDQSKRRRFDLCGTTNPALFSLDYSGGDCAIDGRRPGTETWEGDKKICRLCSDQIDIGKHLVRLNRLLVTREVVNDATLSLDYFGYRVTFTKEKEASGQFGSLAREEKLLRAWDFSLPRDGDSPLWQGYARRAINGFVPKGADGNILEFGDIAQVGEGVAALGVIKGDVDNLGLIFQNGLEHPTFARMAALSRQVNAFFAIYLPWLCSQEYFNTYTVFAGGDDFFLLGPWQEQQDLLQRCRKDFHRYVQNKEIHFSAGFVMAKPGIPVPALASLAEESLEQSKKRMVDKQLVKNAVTCWQRTVSWEDFEKLRHVEQELSELVVRMKNNHGVTVGTAYVYGLLHLCEKAEGKKPEDALWVSWFVYRTWRLVVDRLPNMNEEKKKEIYQKEFMEIIGKRIGEYRENLKIALFRYLYQQREKS
ncbi:MAG: type III-A CRISPR-associated protein Cas10/Csm1 [Magnetococcales bacterium]|nr:type III-A CRISPR-associated protein Cas10/Csm1 [Magnetococcales bacterium]